MIHFVGNNRDSLEGPINDLVHVLLQATGPCKAPTYLQEYTCAKKWCQFWEKNGLIVKDEKKRTSSLLGRSYLSKIIFLNFV